MGNWIIQLSVFGGILARREPEKIGDILKRVVRNLGIDARMREQTLFSIWNEVVGNKIAGHARPSHIRRGRLTVLVENSGYIQEYSFLKKELQRKLNAILDKAIIKEIVFRVG
ncbi:hypothetical protein COS91_02820 [Candidatus Desantisbacteria bacterium CG07_land_8_20_14_0_80_39_15]|uniref:DUF721 domain-containing protein n=2 Tax=unclassified Candidatus Desantisiibacteriota TaxID=3106372 RepID=A0A2H9PAD6_9BACT|nr:MAG: hypothetical protein COS91_02820 [Candidatus Desantisbacteria bacterium CG07_land_8_20_14_0_80_39_15]PIZ15345.1 MAG: hypothetical protein COY51_05490 [Candidatus Desantisbacteria bacterium CG_4_10_14_0_8_um_filter_39_17]